MVLRFRLICGSYLFLLLLAAASSKTSCQNQIVLCEVGDGFRNHREFLALLLIHLTLLIAPDSEIAKGFTLQSPLLRFVCLLRPRFVPNTPRLVSKKITIE